MDRYDFVHQLLNGFRCFKNSNLDQVFANPNTNANVHDILQYRKRGNDGTNVVTSTEGEFHMDFKVSTKDSYKVEERLTLLNINAGNVS